MQIILGMELHPSSAAIQSIEHSTLTPLVCKSLDRDSLNIRDWSVSQLGGGVGNPVSLGLYRFEGIGEGPDNDRVPSS